MAGFSATINPVASGRHNLLYVHNISISLQYYNNIHFSITRCVCVYMFHILVTSSKQRDGYNYYIMYLKIVHFFGVNHPFQLSYRINIVVFDASILLYYSWKNNRDATWEITTAKGCQYTFALWEYFLYSSTMMTGHN